MRGNCYDVTGSIRTTDAGAVGTEVVRLYRKLFASADRQLATYKQTNDLKDVVDTLIAETMEGVPPVSADGIEVREA